MIHTVIWLTVLGIALLVPNVLAVRLALLGVGDAPAGMAVTTRAPGAKALAQARPRSAPQLARKGYLWKAFSPLLFGVTVILGLAVSGIAGYAIMGVGLLNLLWGAWGWDGYIPGKTEKR